MHSGAAACADSARQLLAPPTESARKTKNLHPDNLIVPPQVHDQPRLDLFRFDYLPAPKRQVSRIALPVIFQFHRLVLLHDFRLSRRSKNAVTTRGGWTT